MLKDKDETQKRRAHTKRENQGEKTKGKKGGKMVQMERQILFKIIMCDKGLKHSS